MLFRKTNLLIGLVLLLPLPSLASGLMGGYKASPNAKKVYQRRSVSGGSRTVQCQRTMLRNELALLVPEAEVIHQAATNQPSFFLEAKTVPNQPLEFTLVDPKVAEPLVETPLIIEQKGYQKIDLPSQVKLEPNKTYLWHIKIPCANNSEEAQEVIGAAVEYKPLSSKISSQIQQANSLEEKAQILATNGIWYDAIDLANQAKVGFNSDQYWKLLLKGI